MSMRKIFEFFIEGVFWLQIFLCPLLVGGIIAFLIYNGNSDLLVLSLFFIAIGFILGIVIAERIRRKYGCSRYLSRIISTPDIWPTDDEPLNKPGNT